MASVAAEVHLERAARGALKWGSNRRPRALEVDGRAGKGNTDRTVRADFRLGGCRRRDLGGAPRA